MMRRRSDERGAIAMEFLIMAPLLLAMIFLVVGMGRVAQAGGGVNAAAYEAARAASLERNHGAATAAGQAAATRSLSQRGMSCVGLNVRVDTGDYRAGGQVRARVSCQANLSDLVLVGFPGSKTYTHTAVVPIEQYRSE
ncbi:TadE/TadG family type IV pilus assembly protein [Aeromicrobium sp. CTD01-1L150]|uniref:TadE/TadG family type IV pilus assembly protein n=1 Tax=Aeromicrobium sp. CTD01-1L150 TaxID=3341830 RepID=UPI0035C1B9B1